MPEQNTRLWTEGMKPLQNDFKQLVRHRLTATKTAEDIANELDKAEKELSREVKNLERAVGTLGVLLQ